MLPSDKPKSEMSLGRTILFTIRLYQKGFPSFFLSTLILSVVMFGLLTFVLMYTVNVVEGNPSYYDSAMGMISQFFMISSYLLALSLLYLAGASLLVGYNIRVGDDIVKGKAPDNQRSLQASRNGYVRTLWLFLTLFVGVTVGFWLLWIPGVLAAVLLPMAIPSHCIEGTDVVTSLLRGYRLVRGRWVKTLLLLTFTTFLAGAVFLLVWFTLTTITFLFLGIRGYIVTLILVMMNAAVAYALVEPFLYLTLLSHYYSMYARVGLAPDY
jgi:hypothetical protein